MTPTTPRWNQMTTLRTSSIPTSRRDKINKNNNTMPTDPRNSKLNYYRTTTNAQYRKNSKDTNIYLSLSRRLNNEIYQDILSMDPQTNP